jgi:hypothetical protein
MILIGLPGLLYVPEKLIELGNASATATNIGASEWLVRAGIASELIHQIIFVFLVLALYQLLKPVNESHARQMLLAQLHRRANAGERRQFPVRVRQSAA